MITSAPSSASSMCDKRPTFGASISSSRGTHMAGPYRVMRAPNLLSKWMLERATRLCRMSPRMVTRKPSNFPLRSRMVSASSKAWVGCSCVPSPAFTTGTPRRWATNSGAPEELCRITIPSGRMASRVHTVSSSDSPFFRLEDSACKFMVSAPRRAAAVAKLMRVRVEFSKNASATVLPRKVASFFNGWRRNSWKRLGCSRIKVIFSRGRSSIPSRCCKRCSTVSLYYRFLRASQRIAGASGNTIDEDDTFLAVNLLQANFHYFGVARFHGSTNERRFDRQFSMAAVDQHTKADALGAAEIEEAVHGGTDGAAGVQHVVDDYQIAVIDREIDLVGMNDWLRTHGRKVVAIQRYIESAHGNVNTGRIANRFRQALGQRNAPAAYADQG